jgi:hypothetical protein
MAVFLSSQFAVRFGSHGGAVVRTVVVLVLSFR